MAAVRDYVAESTNESVVAAVPSAPRRVIIVDDDGQLASQFAVLLQTNPALQVTFQTDGQKALAELARADYSIVITDCACRPWTAWK